MACRKLRNEDKHNIDYLWWAGVDRGRHWGFGTEGDCVIIATDRPRALVRVWMFT